MGKTHRKIPNPNGCRQKWDMPHKSVKDYKRIKIRPQDIPEQYLEEESKDENPDPQEENWQDHQDGDDWRYVDSKYQEALDKFELTLPNSTEAALGEQQQSPRIYYHLDFKKAEEEEKHQ